MRVKRRSPPTPPPTYTQLLLAFGRQEAFFRLLLCSRLLETLAHFGLLAFALLGLLARLLQAASARRSSISAV